MLLIIKGVLLVNNKKMKNMQEGKIVICVSDDFTPVWETGDNKQELIRKPTTGEVLTIYEIQGDFLRFKKYDKYNCCNWWHYSKFAPIDQKVINDEIANLKEVLMAAISLN